MSYLEKLTAEEKKTVIEAGGDTEANAKFVFDAREQRVAAKKATDAATALQDKLDAISAKEKADALAKLNDQGKHKEAKELLQADGLQKDAAIAALTQANVQLKLDAVLKKEAPLYGMIREEFTRILDTTMLEKDLNGRYTDESKQKMFAEAARVCPEAFIKGKAPAADTHVPSAKPKPTDEDGIFKNALITGAFRTGRK